MSRFVRASALALLTACVLATPALAQFETGSVLGTIHDNSGGVMPGVTITLLGVDTGVSTTKVTDADGYYEFFTIKPGRYKVTAELSGFTTAVAENVQVSVGNRVRVDLAMKVGGVSESVDVTGGPRLLETDTSQRGQVITGKQAAELPLNGREYSALVLLSTGVRLSALNTGGNTPREGSFNINGLRSTFNNFLIDGVDNNAYGTSNQGFSNQVMQPSPDALAEFRVVTNNMSAEYGRSGGATVNVAYKSGANRFSGAAWEFYRNTSMNAVGFFKPLGGKPQLDRNQFGFVLGGPIMKNKAFFFTDYEGFRQDRQVIAFSTIPTAAQKQGILAVDVRNPLTGVVYPAGTPIAMSALAQKVLSALPDPTSSSASNNYQISEAFSNHNNKYNGKVDAQFTPALMAFGRFGWRKVDLYDQPTIPLPSGGGGNSNTYVRNKQFASGLTWAQSSSRLLEVRFGVSKTTAGKNPVALGQPGAFDAYGIPGLPTDPRIAGGLPTESITGFSDLGRQATNPQWQYPTVFNPKVNYSWTQGRQSFKAGYEYQFIETEVQDVNPLYGRDAYTGQFSRPTGAASNNLYNLADFMFGLRSQYALSNILIAHLRQAMHFAYLQDDLRLTNNLTLNLGVRYEYATPHWERDNILTNFDPVNLTMIQAKDGSIEDRSTIKPDRNNFAPRLGFAYSVTPETVVRGGYGISYIHFNRAGGGNLLPINGPQVINAVVNQTNPTDASFLPTQFGYPAGLTDPSRFNPLTANVTYMPNDYHSSPVQSWFMSVQRELWTNVLLDVAYVGNKGSDLLLFANYNQALPNNAQGTILLQARRPIPQFSDITYAFNGGHSRYDSLQVKFDARLPGNLTLLNSLTLSKATDNGSGSLENPNGNFPAPQNFYNLGAEDGLSAYHQPYNNTTSFVWTLPIGRGHRFLAQSADWVDVLAGGWSLSGINSIYPGEMATLQYTPQATFVVSGIQQDFRGANNYRPNLIGDPYGDKDSVTNYLNPANVVLPTDPSQPFGNAPRNNIRGPMFWQFDAVASKNVRLPVGTQTMMQFRIEAFNLFNHTNFRAPNTNRSAGTFGTITSTYDPRQLQLGIKLLF